MDYDLAPSIGYLTNRAARLFVQSLDVRLRKLGMRAAHMPVLIALHDGNRQSQKQLAEAAGIEQPTMAATLSRMEREGLIDRQADPDDRRSTLIGLSPEALDKIPDVQTIVADITGLAESGFTSGEAEIYNRLITKIIASLLKDPLRS